MPEVGGRSFTRDEGEEYGDRTPVHHFPNVQTLQPVGWREYAHTYVRMYACAYTPTQRAPTPAVTGVLGHHRQTVRHRNQKI